MALTRQIGALSFPLTDTGEATLASLDPGRDILLDLMEAAINYELATRWADAVSGTPVNTGSAQPVMSTLPSEPDEQALKMASKSFPLLCCFDPLEEVSVSEFSVSSQLVNRSLEMHYIIPPGTIGTRRKLTDVFQAVIKCVAGVIEDGGHTAYAMDSTHTSQHKIVLGPGSDTANFYKISLSDVSSGNVAAASDSTKYHVLIMKFAIEELSEHQDGDEAVDYVGFSATDVADPAFAGGLGIATDGEDTITDFVEVTTDYS